jgi:chromosome partitioning protein
VFVISRRIGRTVLGRGIADALAEFGLPILAAGTTQRVAYAEAMTAGKLVSGAAAAEMRTILEELRGLVA